MNNRRPRTLPQPVRLLCLDDDRTISLYAHSNRHHNPSRDNSVVNRTGQLKAVTELLIVLTQYGKLGCKQRLPSIDLPLSFEAYLCLVSCWTSAQLDRGNHCFISWASSALHRYTNGLQTGGQWKRYPLRLRTIR